MPQRVPAPHTESSPLPAAQPRSHHDAMRVPLPLTPDSHSHAPSESGSELLGLPQHRPQQLQQQQQHLQQQQQHLQQQQQQPAAGPPGRSPMARSTSGKSDDTGTTYRDQLAAQQASAAVQRAMQTIMAGPRSWEDKVRKTAAGALRWQHRHDLLQAAHTYMHDICGTSGNLMHHCRIQQHPGCGSSGSVACSTCCKTSVNLQLDGAPCHAAGGCVQAAVRRAAAGW
jgi:hypothetical protein